MQGSLSKEDIQSAPLVVLKEARRVGYCRASYQPNRSDESGLKANYESNPEP
jgi:hypothetical protein